MRVTDKIRMKLKSEIRKSYKSLGNAYRQKNSKLIESLENNINSMEYALEFGIWIK